MGYGGRTDWGGSYGDEWDRQYVSYTATFDSITAFIAIENDLYNGSNYNYGVDTNGDSHSPDSTGNGYVALDQACPTAADVKVTSVSASYDE